MLFYEICFFDKDGIRNWPFTKPYLDWADIVNVITICQPREYQTIIKFIKSGKLNTFTLDYSYILANFTFYDRYFFALKLIVDNLPPQITCDLTKELAKYSRLDKNAEQGYMYLEQKATNLWLKRRLVDAYNICQKILANDRNNTSALRILWFYYCSIENHDKVQQVFDQMQVQNFNDPLVIKSSFEIKFDCMDTTGLEFFIDRYRNTINYPNYNMEFALLEFYFFKIHDIEKSKKQFEYLKALSPTFKDPTHTELLNDFSKKMEI